MSFSFNSVANTKDEVKAKVDQELAVIVNAQPYHKRDVEAVKATVAAYLDMLEIAEGEVIGFSVNGSVGWTETSDGGKRFNSAGVGVSVRSYKNV